MANAGADATGFRELQALLDDFPNEVTSALRTVARDTADRVQARATQILDARTNGKASRIAAISIVDEPEQRQVRVIAEGISGKPANLALWFERGTRYMEARPFMRPAGDAEDDRYKRDSFAAVLRVAEKLVQV